MEKDLLQRIQLQAEFYMSDENLQSDRFFHNQISSSENGFISISHLLNCNKMKKLTEDKAVLQKALKNSKLLVLSKDGELIKRENPKLPTLKSNFLNKKRTDKIEQDKTEISNEPVSKEVTAEEVILFNIKTSKCVDVTWKEIQESISKSNPELIISYLRFSKDSGHLGIAQKHINKLVNTNVELEAPKDSESNETLDTKVLKEDKKTIKEVKDDKVATRGASKSKSKVDIESKVEINEQSNTKKKVVDIKPEKVIIEMSKCLGNDLVDFWKAHGNHLKMCLGKDSKNSKTKDNKKGREAKKEKKFEEDKDNKILAKKGNTKLKKPVSLGHNKFIDIKDIRQKSRSILNNIKEGDKALPHDSKFLSDLIVFHPNKEKAIGLDYFTTGQNPDYVESKCFVVVKKDGSKVDFSVNKCLDFILSEYGIS